jgi:hypothetical protein
VRFRIAPQAFRHFPLEKSLVSMLEQLKRMAKELTSSAAIVTVWFVTIVGRILAWLTIVNRRSGEFRKQLPGYSLWMKIKRWQREVNGRMPVPQLGSNSRY